MYEIYWEIWCLQSVLDNSPVGGGVPGANGLTDAIAP